MSLISFKEAVKALHGLQSNAAYLRSATSSNNKEKLEDTKQFLLRSGITLEQLDKLSIIHVAGTKGKGSTCSFTEAILRTHGYRTGFFSSPHLVSVRERIKINGESISEPDFAHYFWQVYKKLESTKRHETDMPTYFKFLTILMFNVFLNEDIDVAIVEVGIGGELDCTNIIRNPICVGITSLSMDHTSLLGNTIQEIAFQKSGIFKKGTMAFTVPQESDAMKVLWQRSIEKDCKLHVVPLFENYPWATVSHKLAGLSRPLLYNASLAIQLAIEWMRFNSNTNIIINSNNIKRKSHHNLQDIIFNGNKQDSKNGHDTLHFLDTVDWKKIAEALISCKWPGRMQILQSSIVDFFLDGAHTVESIKCCISWFENITSTRKGKRILIFNTSGSRDPIQLLMLLKPLNFHKAYFVPNSAGILSIDDQMNSEVSEEDKTKCKTNCRIWGKESVYSNNFTEVLSLIKQDYAMHDNDTKDQVLVTGSLHLVGAALAVLDPNFTMSTKF